MAALSLSFPEMSPPQDTWAEAQAHGAHAIHPHSALWMCTQVGLTWII